MPCGESLGIGAAVNVEAVIGLGGVDERVTGSGDHLRREAVPDHVDAARADVPVDFPVPGVAERERILPAAPVDDPGQFVEADGVVTRAAVNDASDVPPLVVGVDSDRVTGVVAVDHDMLDVRIGRAVEAERLGILVDGHRNAGGLGVGVDLIKAGVGLYHRGVEQAAKFQPLDQ